MVRIYRRVGAKPADIAVVHRISAQHIINLALSKTVIALVERVAGAEMIGIQERNKCCVCRVTQSAKSVDKHCAAGSSAAGANGPMIEPALGVCSELLFTGQSRHHHVDAEVLVI